MKPLWIFSLNIIFGLFLILQSAARDADKIFLAAIDKFDAMMSKSNDYASDGTMNLPQPVYLLNVFHQNVTLLLNHFNWVYNKIDILILVAREFYMHIIMAPVKSK